MERTKSLLIRCSKEEKSIFEIMAHKNGLPVSTYIRSVILKLYYEGKKSK
jgi:predicted DNA binding CopG/RHH family protein